MSTREKTFSFRAPAELAARLDQTSELWSRLAADDAGAAELAHEVQLQLARRFRATSPDRRTQSDVIRAAVESLTSAVEILAERAELAQEYAAWASEDEEGAAFRTSALRGGASIWNDE